MRVDGFGDDGEGLGGDVEGDEPAAGDAGDDLGGVELGVVVEGPVGFVLAGFGERPVPPRQQPVLEGVGAEPVRLGDEHGLVAVEQLGHFGLAGPGEQLQVRQRQRPRAGCSRHVGHRGGVEAGAAQRRRR